MTPIIQVEKLEKHYKVNKHRSGLFGAAYSFFSHDFQLIRAVDGISFKVQPGELIGYLGPNGAGKSTTIKILTGLLVPTNGTLQVGGLVPWRDRKRFVSRIGAVFGQRTTLWWDLPLRESLELLRYVYQIPADRFRQNLATFRQMLDLDTFLNQPVRLLSLGQRMRADLCAAMLHDPDLVFLDEPSIGLDVIARENIRQFIRDINQARGTTILLTTHDLLDIEKLCERVLIIDHGKVLFDGKLSNLKTRFGGKRELVVEFAEAYEQVDIPGASIREQDSYRVVYQFEGSQLSAADLINRLSTRFRLRDLSVREPDIETTIRRIYQERKL